MNVPVDLVKMVECVQTKSTTSHVDVLLGLPANDVKLVSTMDRSGVELPLYYISILSIYANHVK